MIKTVKIKSIAIILLALVLASGCEDYLELLPPDGLVRNEYWKTKEDVEAVLMGAYQKFAGIDDILFLLGEIRADMIIGDNNTPNFANNIMFGNIFPNNSLCEWSDFYIVINFCNNVLKYAPIVYESDPTFSEYQLRGYEAEAIFLRSLAYFYLIRTWHDVPLFLEASESDAVDFFLPASPASDVLATIKADLLEVRLFVTGDYGNLEENKGRATRAAINALLADISLWNFEYQECIDYIEEVEKDNLFLMPGGKWFEIFYPGNSAEGIFEFQFDASLDQNNGLYEITYEKDYYQLSLVSEALLEPSLSRELIRGNGSGSFLLSSFKVWKYAGTAPDGGQSTRPGSERKSGNFIVYRLADLLLMKAEALSQLDRYDEALEIVNEIRERALMSPVSTSRTREAYEDMILNERARELAFEGKRWFDLLRMGRRNDFARKSKLIAIIIDKVPSTQKLVLATKLINPMGWYLPIEDVELERNYNLKQNPYYADYSTD